MQSQKIVRATRALPASMIDLAREESKLLERWAASDSARALEDTEWDDCADRQDMSSVEWPRDGYFV